MVRASSFFERARTKRRLGRFAEGVLLFFFAFFPRFESGVSKGEFRLGRGRVDAPALMCPAFRVCAPCAKA
ncbi:MAG: hypothetical protein DBX55_02710 [Verrucomicrobia bacterium]|nr:MAG: hypothetical protein DBX55_02710 [Verrucomicrobiota bacterium]